MKPPSLILLSNHGFLQPAQRTSLRKGQGGDDAEIIESLTGAVGGGGGGANKKSGRMSQEEYEATKPAEMRKDIRMISGCEDSQTSADVSNVASFQLPDPAGALYSNCARDCIKACSLE